jgi:hypothetical protein
MNCLLQRSSTASRRATTGSNADLEIEFRCSPLLRLTMLTQELELLLDRLRQRLTFGARCLDDGPMNDPLPLFHVSPPEKDALLRWFSGGDCSSLALP